MDILIKLLLCLLIFIAGVIFHVAFMRGKSTSGLKNPVNELPVVLPQIGKYKLEIYQLYLREWEVIIKTQMHFNDLIIRFRGLTLAAFVALVGASIAAQKAMDLEKSEFLLILIIIGILWITAFILDFGYYHRLLLGSVAQALKFDNSEIFKELGLFGLTTCISEHVHPPTSKILVFIYYVLPLVFSGIAIFTIYFFRIGS